MATDIDPQKKKSDDILEQLGMHPSQLSVQKNLGLSPTDDFVQRLTEAVRGVPAETPTAPPTASVETPAEPKPLITSATSQPVAKPPITMPSPTMKNAQAQVEGGQNELARLNKTGSGISQIDNPFLKTLARIGDIAGTALVPSVTENIPGTESHHRKLINDEFAKIGLGQKQEENEATTEAREALAHKTEAEAKQIDEGGAQEKWKAIPEFTGPNGEPVEINGATGQVRYAGQEVPGIKLIPKGAGREGELPLGAKVDQLNQMLTSRYQVMNPNKPLPPEFTVQKDATQKDYDRIDKALEATEKASATKAQRDTLDEMRTQAHDLAQEKQAEHEEEKGRKPVIGKDEKGRTILTNASDAEKRGLKEVMDAPPPEVGKAMSARHWLPIAEKTGPEDSPDQMGILQLIDVLDKKKKLGPLASRWNEFLAGHYGSGDTYFEALRTKLGLSNTLLMNVHVGNRGGAYMFEHFEDLVNQGRMNAQTLRAGVKAEVDYARDRAMLPDEEKKQEEKHRKVKKSDVLKNLPAGTTYEDAKADAKNHNIEIVEDQ